MPSKSIERDGLCCNHHSVHQVHRDHGRSGSTTRGFLRQGGRWVHVSYRTLAILSHAKKIKIGRFVQGPYLCHVLFRFWFYRIDWFISVMNQWARVGKNLEELVSTRWSYEYRFRSWDPGIIFLCRQKRLDKDGSGVLPPSALYWWKFELSSTFFACLFCTDTSPTKAPQSEKVQMKLPSVTNNKY